MTGIDVIVENVEKNPHCPHGPTLLFSRKVKDGEKRYFACAACRDRKHCSFLVWQDEIGKIPKTKWEIWKKEEKKFLRNINHRKLFQTFMTVSSLPPQQRKFCCTCSQFEFDEYVEKHSTHKMIENIVDQQLTRPSIILPPLEDSKKEAQYFFSKNTVAAITNILKELKFDNIICIGTPRIHEYISNECSTMNSLLLDFDHRYHSFYSPMQFCWYNMFNNYFFFEDARDVFNDFLQSASDKKLALIMDPPFGGRVEPLAHTLTQINEKYKSLKNAEEDLPVFWMFPYFMEPQIVNSLPNYTMLDYKVDYDNHPLFQDGKKGRKQGSPVRIFTNISASLIKLSQEEGYKYCKYCKRWVSKENKHCNLCKACTSKDGRTYKHCDICQRCVKPTWNHCQECNRCASVEHKCEEISFQKECFHCSKPGHKKKDCPDLKQESPKKKRSKLQKQTHKKKRKLK